MGTDLNTKTDAKLDPKSDTKKSYFQLRLNLNEVSDQPRLYTSDRSTGELNAALKDLIGTSPYSVKMELQKVGNAFLAKGTITTEMPLVCSDCSGDYQEPIRLNFQEMLVISQPFQKGDQSSKANHSSEWDDSQPQCIYLDSPVFDVGEFLHEQIALAEPFRPTGSNDPKHVCEDVKSQVQREWLTIGNEDSDLISENNPFKALQGLKLKS